MLSHQLLVTLCQSRLDFYNFFYIHGVCYYFLYFKLCR